MLQKREKLLENKCIIIYASLKISESNSSDFVNVLNMIQVNNEDIKEKLN